MTIALVLGSVVLLVSGLGIFWKRKKIDTSPTLADPYKAAKPAERGKLNDKLAKTRGVLVEKLKQLPWVEKNGAAEVWDEFEEILLGADIGFGTTQLLLEKAREQIKNKKDKNIIDVLRDACLSLFDSCAVSEKPISVLKPKPLVISLVGINGAGKTTTVGKLAQKYRDTGKTVLLGAIDTFRAGAISQLKVWADRTDSQFVTGREGADPGAVAFDSVTAAKSRGIDVVLLDTAGRLHTKANLMEELKKIYRVVKKVIPEAPHETWLVIDGTLGQNSVVQAKEFQKALDLTGVIVTKLDGTAKGGAILAIAAELKLPIKFIGVGETVEDLNPFDSRAFIEAILG
ncbi:MAG: signal recognition particle-docking protein FtsY [Proteobacteria bacterium]|nr:signal recognition particle-docking protein FtsY [Pseudomonadota bacterium]